MTAPHAINTAAGTRRVRSITPPDEEILRQGFRRATPRPSRSLERGRHRRIFDESEHAHRCPHGQFHRESMGMKRTWVVAIALVCLMMIPVAASAADRTVVGSITKADGMNVTVKGLDGKDEMVMLNTKTRVMRGKEKLDAKALKVGDRVVAYGREDKSMIEAKPIISPVVSPAAK